MSNFFDYLNGQTVDFTRFSECLGLALANPFFILLMTAILIDLLSGVGASIVQGKLDSSLMRKGFVKHFTSLAICFIAEAVTSWLSAGFVGNFITFYALSSYFISIPANLIGCGWQAPTWATKILRTELERKFGDNFKIKE